MHSLLSETFSWDSEAFCSECQQTYIRGYYLSFGGAQREARGIQLAHPILEVSKVILESFRVHNYVIQIREHLLPFGISQFAVDQL